MAADTTLNTGSGGDTIRAVDKAGVKAQVVILDMGGAGAESLLTGTLPVSAASLPLPSGAATEAGHLATIDTSTAKIPSQGQALAAASMPVVLTAAQVTTLTPPAAIVGFALEAGHLAAIDTSVAKIPSQGQALAAASMPVVLTAAQLATLTPLASIVVSSSGLPANAAQETGGNLASLVAKDFATQTTLALVGTVLGAEDDEALQARFDEDGTISARLRTISEQMEEFIDTQKTNQELLFRILMALTSDMPKTALEGN